MKVALYVIPIILFVVWIGIIYREFSNMREIRKNPALKNYRNYYDVKRIAKQNPGTHLEGIFNNLKKSKINHMLIWFLSVISSAIILIIIGISTAL